MRNTTDQEVFKPMLAGTPKSPSDIRFPLLASPKLDGIRCLVIGGKLVSRNLKPIPNRYVQKLFATLSEGMDGELILGDPTTDPFRRTTSAVMSEDGEPKDIWYYIFDNFRAAGGFETRFNQVLAWHSTVRPDNTCIVPHDPCYEPETLIAFEEECVTAGYEGVMIRSLTGPYKQGRSTVNEGYLLKIKRFEDSEAEIIGFEERMHNGNTATTNKLGHTERSSHKAGMTGHGDLGALIVRDLKTGVEFNIGSGFTQDERSSLWESKKEVIGAVVKYKFFPVGAKDKPRFPIFLGFRDPRDM